MTPIIFAVSILCSYLIGSIPFGLLFSRLKGVDIRQAGSGNIGATNVFRSVGKSIGIATFACDMLKGFAPAFLFPLLALRFAGYIAPQQTLAIVCGIGAIAGHSWSVFLHFTGGKGVATSAGFLLAIGPASIGIGLLGWVVILLLSGYVSLASMFAGIIITVFGWWQFSRDEYSLTVALIFSLLCLLVIYRHKSNIRRLINGTENRFNILRRRA
jgi:glycerol-3-phosphate acyltransferase PlsY